MDIYSTEDEQAEAVKKWIKTNAPAIVIGIVLGLGGLKGWDYWKLESLKKDALASAEYEAQVLQLESTAIPELEAQLAAFKTRNESKVYNNFLQLRLAKKAIATGDFDVASTALNAVIENAANAAIKHTAVLRLARILVSKEKADDAISLLNRDAETYQELYAQVRGDAYLALGEIEKARQAYLMAKGEAGNGNANLQMKIDNLAYLEVPSIKAESAVVEDTVVETEVEVTETKEVSEEGQ